MENQYDYTIIGSGLFGAIFAYEANKRGKRCIIIEKRKHIGGNVYTEKSENIQIHKYGAHIFHTNNKEIWEYINQFAEFNHFINSPIANYNGEIYNLPFNMNTFNKLWGVVTPQEAIAKIENQKKKYGIIDITNLEEQAISLIGREIYEKLIKGYTEKQWGKKAIELPPFIIKRLPVRMTYNNNYYDSKFQGVPIGGYTQIIEKMLDGIEVHLNTDFFNNRTYYESLGKKIIFTGMIDQFFEYKYGVLEYRSLCFEEEIHNKSNYQGNAVVNFTSSEVPYTRIIEHKHFEFGEQEKTIITKEYPKEWEKGEEPYYPVNTERNNNLYKKYEKLAQQRKNTLFGGRLGSYTYYNMEKVIMAALKAVKAEFENE